MLIESSEENQKNISTHKSSTFAGKVKKKLTSENSMFASKFPGKNESNECFGFLRKLKKTKWGQCVQIEGFGCVFVFEKMLQNLLVFTFLVVSTF